MQLKSLRGWGINLMTLPSAHDNEPHFITRSGWLRAAVLGANDGIVSISSLLVGVAAADPSPRAAFDSRRGGPDCWRDVDGCWRICFGFIAF